jgi:acetoin utilization protein AcuB
MYVGRRMTRNPITATPDTSHREAVDLLRQHRIRRLPILDRGRLVGIVVEEDLLSNQPSPATSLSIYEIHTLLSKLKLADIMVSPVYTVEENCPLEEAARIMIERSFSCLPVMRGDELVGIITETDIFRAFLEVIGDPGDCYRLAVRVEDKPGAIATVTRAIAEAGSNIVNLATFRDDSEIYLKIRGGDMVQLERLIREEAHADLLELGPTRRYEPRPFGQKK